MHKTRNDLPEGTRGKIVAILNDSLANAIDLALQVKQAHWNVKGPNFIALHELFDKVYETVSDHVDSLAERAVQLGGTAQGTLPAVSAATKLSPYPVQITAGRDHVEALSAALATFGRQARANIDEAGKLGDADTADLYTEISRDLDKQLWFVEAHVQAER